MHSLTYQSIISKYNSNFSKSYNSGTTGVTSISGTTGGKGRRLPKGSIPFEGTSMVSSFKFGTGTDRPSSRNIFSRFGSFRIGPIISDTNSKSSTTLSESLQHKITKILKLENKLKGMKSSLVHDFSLWAGTIADTECESMINDFGQLLKYQNDSHDLINEKLEKIKLNLLEVFEREKKMKELYTLRDKLISNLKDLESKNGPGASQSQMILESIEQNKINSDVIKSQFINSITLILKHALIEYATTLQNISGLSNINTEVFFKLLRDRERGNQNIHQSNRIQPRGLTVFNQKNSSYSGGISSIHSNEAQDFARLQKQQTRSGGGSPTKSSPYAQQQEQQQMQQQNLQQDQSSIVMLCEECLKMDIRTRPPCQHYQGSRETSKDVYTPSENWN